MTTIDLSRCEDFDLGPITVRPSSREIANGTSSEIVEPKVMQVLVALASSPGRVVSRDDLIQKCWDGRIVGEDAINRVIGKLRRAADGAASGAFRIETVARVGYRLSLGNSSTPHPGTTASADLTIDLVRPAPRLPAWLLGTALALVGGTAALIYVEKPWQRHDAGSDQVVHSTAVASPMPPAVADLETRGLSAVFENTPEQTAEGVGYLRQANALAPHEAPVWGSLAMSYVLSLGWASPAERPAIETRVRDAAAHALTIDPRESRSAAALVSLEPTFGHWQAKGDAIRLAQQHARPDNGPLLYQEVQLLMAVGRFRDALNRIALLNKFSPLIPWIQATRVDALAATGKLEDADRVAKDALAIWPRDRLTWFTNFDLAAYNGEPQRALAMAADRANWPKNTQPDEILLAKRTVEAMMSHKSADADQVLVAFRSSMPRGQAYAERAMRAAAALGRPREALAIARVLYLSRLPDSPRGTTLPYIGLNEASERPTVSLFLPPAQTMWTDPGFLSLLSNIGLADYWRRTGPPDFCLANGMAKSCRSAGLAR